MLTFLIVYLIVGLFLTLYLIYENPRKFYINFPTTTERLVCIIICSVVYPFVIVSEFYDEWKERKQSTES